MKSMLRKIKSHLGISYNKSDLDLMARESLVRSNGFSGIVQVGNELKFRYRSNDLVARLSPHSDVAVVNQVLVNLEYHPAVDFFRVNFPERTSLKIIDAGANVGYSSVYFSSCFPGAEIACNEPDAGNVEVLNRNLAGPVLEGKVRVFRNGLLGSDSRSIVTNNDFRDGRDWSVTVEEVEGGEGDLTSISVEEVLRQMNWDRVDLIKMDIEGSEKLVFEDVSCLRFLERTTALAIEIHDEFNCRDLIYSRLRQSGFVIFNFAETTLAVKLEEMTVK